MPSNPRKTPSGQRKKVTASAHARVSTRKIQKKNHNQEGSFLQVGMLSSSSTSSPHPASSAEPQGNHDAVLAILSDIKASNRALSERMTKLERQSSELSYPNNHWSQSQGQAVNSCREQHSTSVAPHLHYQARSVRRVQDLHSAAGSTTARVNDELPGSNHCLQPGAFQTYQRLCPTSWLPMTATTGRSLLYVSHIAGLAVIIPMILSQLP